MSADKRGKEPLNVYFVNNIRVFRVPSVCISGISAGVDNVREQKKT
jgi:Na+/H+-dicarboxylate symporter